MRTIRKGEEEASQSSPGWTEIRPNLFVTTGNATGAEQTNAQHGRPLPARTRLKSTPKNVVLAFSHSSSKLQPQLKSRFSKNARDQGSLNSPNQRRLLRYPRYASHAPLTPVRDCGDRARGCSRRKSRTYSETTRCVRLFNNTLFPCGNLTHGEVAVSEDALSGHQRIRFSIPTASNFHERPRNGMGADCLK